MSRVPLLKSFMCGCSLETGAKVIGYAQVLINGLQTIVYMYLVIHISNVANEKGGPEVPPGMLATVTAIYFEALCGMVLLMGIYWDKSGYIKAWVLIQWGIMIQTIANILLSLTLCFLGYTSFLGGFVIIKTIGFVLDVYYTLVVYSYYRKVYYRDTYGSLLYDEVIDSLE